MSAGSFTVHGMSCKPSSCARGTAAASMSLKLGAQIVPPAASTMCGTEGWSRTSLPAVQAGSSTLLALRLWIVR